MINEVMQSNIDNLFIDHEFPDSWVELFNPSDNKTVSLSNWKIGVSQNIAEAWSFPKSATLKPNGYLVVYCDKTNGGMHAPFRIDSGKGSIYLFNEQGEVEEQLDLKKQIEPNISFGRIGDGSDKWGYLTMATPGSSNNGIASASSLALEPVYSHDGFVGVDGKDSFTLTIELPEGAEPGSVLCVTTNGDEPQETDEIEGGVWKRVITQTTVVRAKIFGEKLLPRRSTTHSYIFHPRETSLHIVSIVTNDSYFHDASEGILMGELDGNPNWEKDWRRPINIEIFEGMRQEATINQLAETRVHGGWSRRELQKSLAVYSHKRFGTKRFYTQLWADKPNVTEPQSFLLRNGGNTFANSRINDALGHTIIGRNSEAADWQAYTPAIYYINGQYMGITDIRERSNEDYVSANYDGLEDIDMVENHWDVKAGSANVYNALLDYIESDDFTAEHLDELVDIDNFLDLMVIKVFGHDTDFPINNIVSWKPTAENSKWRFLIKDIDRLGIWWMDANVEEDYYNHLMATNENSKFRHYCYLFTRFYEHPDLYPLFIERMVVYMGDMLSLKNAQSLIDEMTEAIDPEYIDHLKVYYPNDYLKYYDGEHGWKWSTDYLRNDWWPRRMNAVYRHLQERYDLDTPVPMNIYHENIPTIFNGIHLSQDEWSGKYFANRPIHLSTTDDKYCWIVETSRNGKIYEQRFNSVDAEFSIPSDAQKVDIRLEVRNTSLESMTEDEIVVRGDNNHVIVHSTSAIETIEISDTLGRVIHKSTPNACHADVLLNTPSGIVIVKIKTATAPIRTIKLAMYPAAVV